MQVSEVIKYPILTEKTYAQMNNGIYTFAVDKRTNKAEVKKVVEFIFDVKVEKVNIMTVRKKPKKLGKFAGFKSGFKKAIITLKDGQTIPLFPGDNSAQQTNPEATLISAQDQTDQDLEQPISAAEQKAAAKIAAKAAAKVAEQTSDNQEETKPLIAGDADSPEFDE